MRYYIVDDEIGMVKALENIVESRGLGETVGYETDPEQAVKDINRELRMKQEEYGVMSYE